LRRSAAGNRGGIQQDYSGVPYKIARVERQQVRQSVSLHRGDQSRIVHLLALYLAAHGKLLPRFENRSFIAQRGEEGFHVIQHAAGLIDRKPRPFAVNGRVKTAQSS
jgi:hypothetical protein